MPINRMATRDFIKVKERNRLQSLITDQTPNSDPELIKKVREVIMKDFAAHPDLYDPSDIERFQKSDWTVSRFLLRKQLDAAAAAQMIIDCGKWRHRLGMPRWKDTDFPEEFYKIGAMFPYEEDKLGNTVIFVRARFYTKKLECVKDLLQRFLIHIANRVDSERDGRGMAILFDCTGAGMANVDMSMLWFMINEIIPHLPKGLNYVLVYQLPWILRATLSMATKCLPADYRKLINQAGSSDVYEWIAKENLPDFMGGTCDKNYRRAPSGCKSLAELKDELGITQDQVNAVLKVYAPYLDEADKAMAARRKNIRRGSSKLNIWYWIKQDDSTTNKSNEEDNDKANNGAKTDSRKISATGKPKLDAIQDEEQ
ncbi:Motile sperm domain-containing protein 2 [Fragariocoptes setiger]|uniref:Motile sperm domain-containing protein 2 n=1 Tax=Fragariocoptes setiger TaxID=1670756 RepID=A0ABQ7S7D4_9ACAR|nr:Motile sperm domain-containing protein 2 [Fragariocoptes setiger]